MYWYREFAYNTQADPSHAELILANHRNGPKWGKDPAQLEGRCAKFLTSERGLGEGSVSPATMHSSNGFLGLQPAKGPRLISTRVVVWPNGGHH